MQAVPLGSSSDPDRKKFDAIAAFETIFTSPDFSAGVMAPVRTDGSFSMGGEPVYDPAVDAFVDACYLHGWVDPNFDWVKWKTSAEASALLVDGTIAAASEADLVCLLTTFIRQERFVDGALLSAFEAGYIGAIVGRVAQLATAPPREV